MAFRPESSSSFNSSLTSSGAWEELPQFLPLRGDTFDQVVDLLIKKGGMLTPALSKAEAQGLARCMVFEHFKAGSTISFNAQSHETGRLMMILAGEANIRMRGQSASRADYSPLGQVQSKWFNVGEGATLGLVHAFSGLSSRFTAYVVSDMFVASMQRVVFHKLKQQEPALALRFLEITALELALVALDHEKSMVALTQVARSMQDHIGDESGATRPAPLFNLDGP